MTVVEQPLMIVGFERDKEETVFTVREGCWALRLALLGLSLPASASVALIAEMWGMSRVVGLHGMEP
jgi:hypothetical protein